MFRIRNLKWAGGVATAVASYWFLWCVALRSDAGLYPGEGHTGCALIFGWLDLLQGRPPSASGSRAYNIEKKFDF